MVTDDVQSYCQFALLAELVAVNTNTVKVFNFEGIKFRG